MTTPVIAFIGAGNMATSIIGGLVAAGHPAQQIRAADPFAESLQRLSEVAPVVTCNNNIEAVTGADVVILAVKPQVMAAVCADIRTGLADTSTLVISIAAGITIDSMQSWIGEDTPIVRCMPNTPALLGCGASGLYANSNVTAQQRDWAAQILSAVGIIDWVPAEHDLDAVTALSGSGPAYFFLLMEAMVDAAVSQGLSLETATRLTLQTGMGAARMGLEKDLDLAELRRRVTSPGGTTEAAVKEFEASGLRKLVSDAMQAAADRADAMAKEMG
ncbi:pyrroline-5-carboxylate reductase [Pseudohalioglobus lutimaris]|uniref:Pyrroline-5-carboxylate reductase n=1 Tax=Pseudohalioglobus lutimaris TaxID=1737061 RepID=A0A2N5X955_9GAMM|nr:pyrroline-5-carboxylate reductase [Pseudohalioglobus lutimaris]PLW71027.1 pyrroline-5-carboxylate reductase [Pseudohalioglobus lutimaris]